MPIVPLKQSSPVPVASTPIRVDPRPRRRPIVSKEGPAIPPSPAPSDPHHKVGYKSPPLHSRFSKDNPGNRKGRPKGAKSLKTLIRALLTQKVKVRTSSGMKTMTKMEAMLQKILEQAFSGNLRALQSFVTLYEQAVPDEPLTADGKAKPATAAELDEHDQAMLDELQAKLIEKGEDK